MKVADSSTSAPPTPAAEQGSELGPPLGGPGALSIHSVKFRIAVYCAKCSFLFFSSAPYFERIYKTDFGLETEPALSAGKGFAASLPAAGGFDTTERGVEGTGGGRL